MTHIYYTVTMRHVAHSYGQALIYIHQLHEAAHWWVHVYWKFKIKSMRLSIWQYTMSIHFRWYSKQLLVHLVSINRHSLIHVSLHHIICTHSYLLVDPNITHDSPLLHHDLHNNDTGISVCATEYLMDFMGSFWPRISYK